MFFKKRRNNMSLPPIRRQSGMINVRDALKTETNLEHYKEAQYTKPTHGEIVSGWDGKRFVNCKYDSVDNVWLGLDEKKIDKIQMWSSLINK
jgi:hypothetical protein